MRVALGLTANIKDSLVFRLGSTVEDAVYPNRVGEQDREAAGGEVFPGRALAFDGVDQCAYVADEGDLDIANTQSVAIGDELLPNNTFTDWTNDDPDGYAIYGLGGEDVDNYVTQVPTGARIFRTDHGIGISVGGALVIGKKYRLVVDVEVTSGRLSWSTGVHNLIDSSGVQEIEVIASTDVFILYAYDNGTDAIVKSVYLTEVTQDFVLSGWIKTGSDISTTKYVFGKSANSIINGRYGFYVAGGSLVFGYNTSTGFASIIDSIVLAVNTEYHVSVRIDLVESKAYFYIDGVIQNAGGTSFTGEFANMADIYKFYIGAGNLTGSGDPVLQYECEVRDVRVYHKDVTAQLDDLMAGEQLGDEVAWWFCEGTDTLEVHDASGNGYHMTAVNFDATSFVEGNWQSLYNKFGYAKDVYGQNIIDDPGFDSDDYWATPSNNWSIVDGVLQHALGSISGLSKQELTIGRKYIGQVDKITETGGVSLAIRIGTDYHFLSAGVGTFQTSVYTAGSSYLGFYPNNPGDWAGTLDNAVFLPYYDTDIPPDMSTAVGGVPTHDIFGNELTFKGQAQYKAIARDRSCFIGDGAAHLVMNESVTLSQTSWEVEARMFMGGSWLGSSSGVLSAPASVPYMLRESSSLLYAYYMRYDDNSIVDAISTPITPLLTNEWATLKLTCDGEYINLYIDGGFISRKQLIKPLHPTYNQFSRIGIAFNAINQPIEYVKITNNGSVAANWQFVEGQGTTVYDVSGNGNHLTGVNMDETNWGVIDTPEEDYIAEYGCSLSVYKPSGEADGILNEPIVVSYDDAFYLKLIVKASGTGEYILGRSDDTDDYIRLTNLQEMTVEINNEVVTYSGTSFPIDMTEKSEIILTKPASSNAPLTITVDGYELVPTGSHTYSSGFSVEFDQLGARYTYETGDACELYYMEYNGTVYSLLLEDLLETNVGLEQRVIPAVPYENTYVARFNGTDNIAGLRIDDFRSSDSSGSIKARVYLEEVGSPIYVFSNMDAAQGSVYLCASIDVSGKPYLDVRNGATFWNRLQADDALSAGWHELEFISDGSSYDIKVDGSSVDFTVAAGNDDGKWFADFIQLDEINIGSIGDVSPTYGKGKIDWVKINDGIAGDWIADPTVGGFKDQSSAGNDMYMLGGFPRYEIKSQVAAQPSLDANYLPLQYKQQGANLIPYTYLSMPGDVKELYDADQQERYEGGLMDEGKGTFTVELGDSLLDEGRGTFTAEYGDELQPDPNFQDSGAWIGGAGWIIGNGFATKTLGSTTTIYVSSPVNEIVIGKRYLLEFTIVDPGASGVNFFITGSDSTGYITEAGSYAIAVEATTDVELFGMRSSECVVSSFSISEILNDSDIEKWNVWGTNTIKNVDGALEITYVDTSNGAFSYLRIDGDIDRNLTVGTRYRAAFRAKVDGTAFVGVSAGGTFGAELTDEYAWYQIDFAATSATGNYVFCYGLGAGEKVYIDQWNLQEIIDDSDIEKWTPFGNNTIRNVDDALEISYVDQTIGAYTYLGGVTGDINTNLVIGDTYKLVIRAKSVSVSGAPQIQVGGYSVDERVTPTSEFTWMELEFVANDVAGHTIRLQNLSAGETVTIDQWELFHKTTPTGNNLIENGGARNRLGTLITTDWEKTEGLYDIIGFEDHGSTIDGATKVRTISDIDSNSGDFTADSWTKEDGWSYGSAQYTNDGQNKRIFRTMNFGGALQNKYIYVELDVSAYTSGDIQSRCGAGADVSYGITGVGTYKLILLSGDGNATFILDSLSFIGSISGVRVRYLTTATAVDAGPAVTTGRLIDQIPQGDELLTNGDFANWTGDDPDDWSVQNDDGSNYVTEDSGKCKFINAAGSVNLRIYQGGVFTKGKYYKVTMECTSFSGTGINITDGVTGFGAIDSVGSFTFVFRAAGTAIWILAYSACDITIDNVSAKELQVLSDDLITNGSFTANANLNVSTCVNDSYTSFANGTATGFDVVSDGSGNQAAGTADEIAITTGNKYIISFDMVLNSGAAPFYNLRAAHGSTSRTVEGAQTAEAGHNVFQFTANANDTVLLSFYNSSAASDYEITNLSVSDAVTDWAPLDGWIIADGKASCDGTDTKRISQPDVYDIGDVVLVKLTVSDYVSGELAIRVGDQYHYPGITSNGTYSILAVADETIFAFYPHANDYFNGSVDNVSVHKLTWGRQITDDSTNYAGFQYALPIDEFDFAIPVDYVAESIVAQQFHDGFADETSIQMADGNPGGIVTGNGFSGKAQRINGAIGENRAYFRMPGFVMSIGKRVYVKLRYRSSKDLSWFNGIVLDDGDIPANTGDAIIYEGYGTGNYNGLISTRFGINGTSDEYQWLEFDELEIRHVLDGEFYEPEAISGDPVIVSTNYFYENPSMYLTRYFNAEQWKDLILLAPNDDLTYNDHLKLMKLTKNN
jgi:hypothetical protein